jgi:hypothetical protein
MNRIGCAAVLLCAIAAPMSNAQWTIQDSHITADLRGIHYLGNGVAWASGTEGTVLRTTNDGKDWRRCATPPDGEHLDFRGIQAFDGDTAIVMSSGKGPLSRLYKTTDGCRTWKLVFTNPDREGFWDALQFADSQNGYLLGDPVVLGKPEQKTFALFRSADSGQTWNRADEAHSFTPYNSDAAIFAASNSSMLIRTSPIFVTGGSRINLYNGMVTSNYSLVGPNPGTFTKPYTVIRLPIASGVTAGGFSLASTKAGVGIVVGGDYSRPNEASYTAVYSTDGRLLRWDKPETFPHGYRSAVAYDATTKTWITVGPNGTDISTDDGRNWRPLRPGPNDAPDADQHWNALSLPFVVGPHGRIGKLEVQALPH